LIILLVVLGALALWWWWWRVRNGSDWPADLSIYRAWLDDEKAMVWVHLDRRGRLLRAGGPVAVRLGIDGTAGRGRLITTLAADESSGAFSDAFHRVIKGGEPQHVELQLRTADGRKLAVKGAIGRRAAIFREASMEQMIANVRTRSAAIARQLRRAMLVENTAGEVVAVNEEFCRLFGLTDKPIKLAGIASTELWQKATRPPFGRLREAFLRELGAFRARGEPVHGVKQRPDEGASLMCDYVPLPDSGEHLWMFRDLSKEARADAALREQETQLGNKFNYEADTIRLALVGADAEGRLIGVNDAFCRWIGFSREELLKQTEGSLCTAGESNEIAVAPLARLVAENRGFQVTKRYQSKAGATLGARVSVSLVRDAQGAPNYFLYHFQEVNLPARWQEKEPLGPWCPDDLREFLPVGAAETFYKHAFHRIDSAPRSWRLAAATRRGRLHAHHGTFREDAFRWENGSDFTVVAVSDGAGSCPLSRLGSEIVCRVVTAFIKEQLDAQHESLVSAAAGDDLPKFIAQRMVDAVGEACRVLRETASRSGHKPEEFRCTLLLAVLHERSDGTGALLVSQIGDGCAGILERTGKTRRLAEPDSGEFSGQVTCFVPDAEAVQKAGRIRTVALADAEVLMLCSDGIEDPFFPIDRRLPELFGQMYGGVERPLPDFEDQLVLSSIIGSSNSDPALLDEWLKFEKRGENDDRTILLLYREPARLSAADIAAGALVDANETPDPTS
jgi:PAS domain S-box-containing protein